MVIFELDVIFAIIGIVMAKKTQPKASTSTELPQKTSGRVIFNQVVLLFLIGCVFGTYYEEILRIVVNFYSTGSFVWESRRGLVWGPFSPVYGIGAVCIYFLFYRTKCNFVTCFIGGAFAGGIIEYILSFLQEKLFGTISWDYSDRLLNINGRTTIPYMIVWGTVIALFAYFVYPWLDRLYHQVPEATMNGVCVAVALVLLIDITVSAAAVARQSMRKLGDPADNVVESWLDDTFDDERLRRTYTNMRFLNEQEPV